MNPPTPLLEAFERSEVSREVRLLVATGRLAPRASEQLAMLVLLLGDADEEVRTSAQRTLDRIPEAKIAACLAGADASTALRAFFAARGVFPAASAAALEENEPLTDANVAGGARLDTASPSHESVAQQITKMSMVERLKAAVNGTREMRSILVRDPNKMIALAVLSSPKLTEAEVEGFARMANVTEDVLRVIGSNRRWMKNYAVVAGLVRNPKTPLGLSLNLLSRLADRDVQMVSIDRNLPEPLRLAARKRMTSGSRRR